MVQMVQVVHLIQFDNDKAGYRTRWIDLTQTEFKLIKHSKTSFYKLETFLPELTTPYLSCQTEERIPLVDTIVKRLDHVYNKMKLLQDEDEEQSLVVVASP